MLQSGIAARIVFVLCLAVGIGTQVSFFSPPAKAAADDAGSLVSVVSIFYKNYIEAMLKDFAGEKVDYDFRQQHEVDVAFVQKIEKLIKDAEDSEFGSLEYDPILMAQDMPEGMQYVEPVIKGDSAELIAYTLWSGGSKNAICVSLVKKANGWRIIDVIDMEEEETIQECGGMKTGR